MAQARRARAINRRGKKRGSVTYSTDREDEVSKIFISFVCLKGSRTISIHEERLQISEAGRKQTNQFQIVFKSLACLSTQSKRKFYLLYKLRKFGDKSRNSLATKIFKF